MGNTLKKNYIYNVLYQVLIILVPLFTSPYLTRVLGSESLGIYSFTQSFAHYFVLFVLLGVENYGNREIARVRDQKERIKETFWEIYTLQLLLFLLVVLVYSLWLCLFVRENSIIYWLQLLYVISSGLDINWCFFGLERFKLTVTRNSIIKILSAAAIFLFVKSKSDLWIYTVISAGSLLVSQAVLWPYILKEYGYKTPSKSGVVRHIKPNLILFLPVLSVSLYTIMDKLMLGVISTKDEVGYYAYSERIIQIPLSFITALGTVLLPRASNLAIQGDSKTRKELLDKSMQFSMLMSISFAFGLLAIADQFIPWYYGADFTRCSGFVKLLVPVIVLTSWNTIIRTQIVIPDKMDKEYLYAVLSGAVINLVLNSVLIPYFQGTGAVIATVVAQSTVCLVQYITVRKKVSIKTYMIDICAFSFAGAAMCVVLLIIPCMVNIVVVDLLMRVVVGFVIGGVLNIGYLVLLKKDRRLINAVISSVRRKRA